jgi:hypothetical protein
LDYLLRFDNLCSSCANFSTWSVLGTLGCSEPFELLSLIASSLMLRSLSLWRSETLLKLLRVVLPSSQHWDVWFDLDLPDSGMGRFRPCNSPSFQWLDSSACSRLLWGVWWLADTSSSDEFVICLICSCDVSAFLWRSLLSSTVLATHGIPSLPFLLELELGWGPANFSRMFLPCNTDTNISCLGCHRHKIQVGTAFGWKRIGYTSLSITTTCLPNQLKSNTKVWSSK